jgi:hypothetical protein
MSPQHEKQLELDQLREELHALQRRVDALERSGAPRLQSAPLPAGGVPRIPELEASIPGLAGMPNAVPVLGRAVLGLAGAYLLRALSETGSLPRAAVAFVAILYAFGWLIWSARSMWQNALAGTTYAVTASLILTPLLWESTVRFNALPPAATAAILTAFFAVGFALSWKREITAPSPVAAVTAAASLATALVLMISTGDLLPFELAIVAIAAAVEAGATVGHGRNLRAMAALAADFALLLMIFLATRPGGWPEHYRPVPAGVCVALGAALLAIYAAGAAWQCVAKLHTIAVVEVVQISVAFVLAAGGALLVTGFQAAASVGGLCALGCAAAYFIAFTRFPKARRNRYVFAAWGLSLGLAACALILPALEAMLVLSCAAVVALVTGARTRRPTLILHGNVYLLAAALAVSLPQRFMAAFTGETLQSAPAALWVIGIASGCCYAACLFAAREITPRFSIVSALTLAASLASLLILALAPVLGAGNAPSFLATFRTLVICGMALGLAFAGSHAKRRELIWISYAAIALGTVKLITEDFRHSRPAALAISLVIYGVLLILVPKLSAKSAAR